MKNELWTVQLDKEKCSICEVCARRCPKKALTLSTNNNTTELLFNIEFCDGCNGKPVCETSCPEEAIHIQKDNNIPGKFPCTLSLISGEVIKCKICSSSFSPKTKLGILLKKEKISSQEIHRICPECRREYIIKNFIMNMKYDI